MSTTNSAASGGAEAGDSVRDGVKGVFGATEDLRKGINNFFDESLQPSAKRDADAGVTSQHKPTVGGGTSDTTTSGSTHTAASSGAGFSEDAKALGKSLEREVQGSGSGKTA